MRRVEDIAVFVCNRPSKNNEYLYQNIRKYFIEEKKKSGLTRKKIKEILGTDMGSHYFTNGQQFILPNEKTYKKLQSTGYFNRSYEELTKEFKEEYNNKIVNKSATYNPRGIIKVKPFIQKKTIEQYIRQHE